MAQALESRRDLGSAAMLVGEQRLLFVFVDDHGAGPWTRELREHVEGKIEHALNWIDNKARGCGIQLRLTHASAPRERSIAIHAGRRIAHEDCHAGPGHSTWQNHVVAELTGSGSVASRWSELFEKCGLPLDDSDGSAVFFCVRRHHPSLAFPFREGDNSEFDRERAIIYDRGGAGGQRYLESLLAHEILHLYGAVDLAPGKAPPPLRSDADSFADDVMHTPTRHPLRGYCIGDLTRYLIGWCDSKPAWLT